MNNNAVAHTRLVEVARNRSPPGVMYERVNTVPTAKRITRHGASQSTPNITYRPPVDINAFHQAYGYLEDEYYQPSINSVHEFTYGRGFRESILIARCCEQYGDNHTKIEERRHDECISDNTTGINKYFIKSKSLSVRGGFICKKEKMKKSHILKGKDHLFSTSTIHKGSHHNYNLNSINIEDVAANTVDKKSSELLKQVQKASKILDGVRKRSKSVGKDKSGDESSDDERDVSDNENISGSKSSTRTVEHPSTFNTIRLKIVGLVLLQWLLIASTYNLKERNWVLSSDGTIINDASQQRSRSYLRPMNPLLTVSIDFVWSRAILTILAGCLSLYGLWENNGKKTLPTIMLTLANIVFEMIDTVVTSCYIAAVVGLFDAVVFASSSACLIFMQMYFCIGVIEFFERTVRSDWIKKQLNVSDP